MKGLYTIFVAMLGTIARFSHAQDSTSSTTSHDACCAALAKIADLHVLYPFTPSYTNRTESYWSLSAQLTPSCIAQPLTVSAVSTLLKSITEENSACAFTNFALRSGGHTTWSGSNNIADGITIDTGLMNGTTFNAETEVASVLPGARWENVYAALDPLGYTVAGGRAGSVGVAGFLTGGGNSFYTAKKGFACDTVVNFEVVLANGDIIDANVTSNTDLFVALKGGSGSNFGIVTRFDMQAFSAGPLWGGTVMYPTNVTQQHIDAYIAWTDNVASYPDGSSIIFWSYLPSVGDIVILAAYEDTAGNVRPGGFDKFMAIPGNMSDTMRLASHKQLTDELGQATGYRDIWFTLTFSNNPSIFSKIVAYHAQFVAEWKLVSSDPDFITQCMFQAIPTVFAQHSVKNGGNVLGLDKEPNNAIMLLLDIAVKSADLEIKAREMLDRYGLLMKEAARSEGGDVEWTYLNYADGWQDPLRSYGVENIGKIRAAAAKYDTEGFFQERVPGGFKISKVKSEEAPMKGEL